MYKVLKVIEFCYGHRLLDYEGVCKHHHGHNGRVEIEVQLDQLDKRSMVLDFGEIKRVLKSWIDKVLDHRMILRKDDPLIPVLNTLGEPVFVLDTNPTAEALAKLIYDYAVTQGLPVTEIRFWETERSVATYAGPGPATPQLTHDPAAQLRAPQGLPTSS